MSKFAEKNILVMFVRIPKYLCGDDSSKMCKKKIGRASCRERVSSAG